MLYNSKDNLKKRELRVCGRQHRPQPPSLSYLLR